MLSYAKYTGIHTSVRNKDVRLKTQTIKIIIHFIRHISVRFGLESIPAIDLMYLADSKAVWKWICSPITLICVWNKQENKHADWMDMIRDGLFFIRLTIMDARISGQISFNQTITFICHNLIIISILFLFTIEFWIHFLEYFMNSNSKRSPFALTVFRTSEIRRILARACRAFIINFNAITILHSGAAEFAFQMWSCGWLITDNFNIVFGYIENDRRKYNLETPINQLHMTMVQYTHGTTSCLDSNDLCNILGHKT